MSAVSLADAKAHLSELVSKAEKGEEIVITRHGQAVAKLVPLAPPKLPLRALAELRARVPAQLITSAEIVRQQRDEQY